LKTKLLQLYYFSANFPLPDENYEQHKTKMDSLGKFLFKLNNMASRRIQSTHDNFSVAVFHEITLVASNDNYSQHIIDLLLLPVVYFIIFHSSIQLLVLTFKKVTLVGIDVSYEIRIFASK